MIIIKKHYKFIIPILLMALISIFSIRSAGILTNNSDNLMVKQITWYLIGFIITFIIYKIDNKKIYDLSIILYIIFNILLLSLLLFGKPINNSKCWFSIGFITFQPSEFMKIILIILLSSMIYKFNNNYDNHKAKDEFIFLLKIFFIISIPSLLTFLEPDTGAVIIYLLITISMLFISGIRYRWFMFGFILIIIFLLSLIYIYKTNNDLFIKLFGTSFFLRIDRLLDWNIKNGYQLNNSLVIIGASGLLGFGFNNTPMYLPEANTDFIFSIISSNKGFIGSIILLLTITYFDIMVVKLALKVNNKQDKYILAGIIGVLLYSQFQNIGMTIGVLPITGITLPFISYGGSSLISYMIILGIILNIEKKIA